MKQIKRSLLCLTMVAGLATGFTGCKSGPKDTDIVAAIEQQKSTLTDMAGVTVAVKDGVVTLSGAVKDDAAKAAVEAAVKAVAGVKSVSSQLTVLPPPPPPPVVIAADDPLTAGVKDALKDFSTVTADVKDGVVTLTGDLKRADLPRVMKALNTLKPKKIENKLNLK
jgi:osmotically-inducible protein OsmY